MDALNLGLGMANAAANAHSAAKLEEMRQQGAEAALMQELIKYLRNEIFNFKKSAEAILEAEDVEPKVRVGALKLLEARLEQSGIEPTLFVELADKEYASDTIKLIQSNSSQLFLALSPPEQKETEQAVEAVMQLSEYEFYLENHDDFEEISRAKEVYDLYKTRHGCLMSMVILFGGFMILSILCSISSGINLIVSQPLIALFGSESAIVSIVGVIMLILTGMTIVAGLVWYGITVSRWQNSKKYNEAKRKIENSKDQYDISRAIEIEAKLENYSREDIVAMRDEAQATLKSFFGESPLQLMQ
ncbi:MAG: hypothetical protein KDD89_10970 [Anaerolineales bacterium]|nr:hypothetical protein [Anaerolineales bacterium]